MKVTKQKENYLLTNEHGEYHFSHEEYEKLGEEKAIEFADKEIEKKLKGNYTDKTINFEQARSLGFCEYGIKDFVKKLDLDINSSYKIDDLLDKLTVDTFLDYPSECDKLFTANAVVSKFGGIKKLLSENRTSTVLNYVLRGDFIKDKELHLLGCDFAERVLPIFEKHYPQDNRPRRAIEVKRLWIGEEFKYE